MIINEAKLAIVHDWFQKDSLGGSEKVTFLLDNLLNKNYSSPDIFSLTSNLKKIKNKRIKTSFIQSLPFGAISVQKYLPLLPLAIEQLDLRKYDLILSSSHAFAKGVLTSPNQLHISYVHTPMRYAWDQMSNYMEHSKIAKLGLEIPIRYSLYKLREWDFFSSQRIDFIISNSNFTAKRVKKYWGLDSSVIHPPVDIERFKWNQNRGSYYLSVNRLVPNKRIDLLISAFNKLGLPLLIIGDGPEKKKLKKMSNSNIKFLNRIDDLQVSSYLSKCRAFVYAGLEDFGIAPVEALASGAPVIAYGKGGVLDTINCLTKCRKDELPNGILFEKQDSQSIVDTIDWFEDKKIWKKFDSKDLNAFSKRFSINNFENKFDSFINNAWEEFNK